MLSRPPCLAGTHAHAHAKKSNQRLERCAGASVSVQQRRTGERHLALAASASALCPPGALSAAERGICCLRLSLDVVNRRPLQALCRRPTAEAKQHASSPVQIVSSGCLNKETTTDS